VPGHSQVSEPSFFLLKQEGIPYDYILIKGKSVFTRKIKNKETEKAKEQKIK
jgi:hypothetical protein